MVGRGAGVCAGKNRGDAESGDEPNFDAAARRDGERVSGTNRIARAAIAAGLFVLLGVSFGNANSQVTLQDGASLPAASSVAKPRAYVSLDAVPAGHPFEIAVVVD